MPAATIDPAKVPLSDLAEVALTALMEAGLAIWTARHRIVSGADKRANASKIFNEVEAIDLVAAEDGAVVAAGSEADDKN